MEMVYRIIAVCIQFSLTWSFATADGYQEGHWGPWGTFSPCSSTCGIGSTSMERVWIPGPDEPPRDEPFTSTQVFPCTNEIYPECPQDGVWSGWMSWSKCTKPCGGGIRERQRECSGQSYEGKPCEGESIDREECNREPCPPLPRNFDLSQCKDGLNFTCSSQKMCVPLPQKCDRKFQCHDGSDEEDCPDIFLMRGGGVRYDLSLWRSGAVSKSSISIVELLAVTFMLITFPYFSSL